MVRSSGVTRPPASGQCPPPCGSLRYTRWSVRKIVLWYGERHETYTSYRCGKYWHVAYADRLTKASRRRVKAGAR